MLLQDIAELRHTLHQYPELSCREKRTVETLIQFLTAHTKLEIVPRDGWFYAVYRAGTAAKRPPIAFRADFDALPMEEGISLPYASKNPGVAHKCGHDGHAAALAGFGCLLEELSPPRDVYLIFQHGEEIGAGGEACSRLIAEKQIGEVYACHNWSGFPLGQILTREGTAQCASQGLILSFRGSPAHASQPEDGRNPCKALSLLALWLQEEAGWERQTADRPLLFATVVGMKAGGRNFGMSAALGELSVTLRGERQADMEALKDTLIEKAKELAALEGLTFTYEDVDVFPETACDSEAVEKVRRAAASLRLDYQRLEKPIRASEDFGYYLKQCPGAIFYIGNGTDYPEIHTREYDFPDGNLDTIIKMFSALCMA